MEVDKIRYRFESHLVKFYPDLSLQMKRVSLQFHPNEQMKETGNEYCSPGVQLMWMMFLAGSVSQHNNTTVLLPSLREKPDGFYDAGYNEGILDCRKHLASAGIKIKK